MSGNILEELAGMEEHLQLPVMPPENITTQQLYALMVAQNAKLQVMLRHVIELHREQKQNADAQRDMLETWKTAGNILKFIKMVGQLGLAVTAIFGLLTYIIKRGGPPS